MADLERVRSNTVIRTNDKQMGRIKGAIPFIQADSMDRIINLLENLHNNPMTANEIAELMDFELRQSDYYFNAGKYLGLFEKKTEDRQKIVTLTNLGTKVYKLNYKQRQLKLVSLILEHQIFADLFDLVIENGVIPERDIVEIYMKKYNVCGEKVMERRASSVQGWLEWIFNLTRI